MTKEELQAGIQRYTTDTRRLNAVAVTASISFLVLFGAEIIGLARRGSLPSNRLVVLLPAAAISAAACGLLLRKIKELQRKHGLLYQSCGLLVTSRARPEIALPPPGVFGKQIGAFRQ
jgi:hypothetical protein